MKPVRVTLITVSGGTSNHQVMTLEEMQSLVGGYVEMVGLPDHDAYLNEDGAALNLPVNPTATRVMKRELARAGRRLLCQNGWVLGPVFFAGHCDDEGEMTDCPPLSVL